MECTYRPRLGQVVLLESVLTDPDEVARSGVVAGVVDGHAVLELTCSSPPPPDGSRMITAHFAPEALYRMTATVRSLEPGFVILEDCDHLETIQRRRWPRCAATMPVVLVPADDDELVGVRGETIDIGIGGTFVHTWGRLPAGVDPLVSLTMPEGDTLLLRATVISVDTHDVSCDYRLAFRDLDETEVARLADLTRRSTERSHGAARAGITHI